MAWAAIQSVKNKIESAKYFKKYTLDLKVKICVFNVFKELSVDAKIDGLPIPLWG